MGTNTLTTIGNTTPTPGIGDTIDQYKTAITLDFVPRNISGVPTSAGGSLGTSSYVWASAYIDNILINGNTISSTDTNGDINLTPNGSGSVVISKTDINSGSIDGVTIGTSSACSDLRVDNLKLDGNTISSTDTNGDINLTPNGSGKTNITSILTFPMISNLGTGTQNELVIGNAAFVEVVNNIGTLNGIASGSDGRVLMITFRYQTTINDASGSASAEDQIYTPTGAAVTMPQHTVIKLIYDGVYHGKWLMF